MHAHYGKAIARDKIEARFLEVLAEIQSKPNVVRIAKEMFQDAWTQYVAQIGHASLKFEQEADRLETEIARLVDCIMNASSPRVIAAYESRIEALERKKLLAQERAERAPQVEDRLGDMFEHALYVLTNPLKAWKTGCFELQRPLLRMAFSGPLEYCRESGFRTPKTTLPFKVLGSFCGQEMKMVPLE